jgi:NDP-sugar pyrophosphorylase family protein
MLEDIQIVILAGGMAKRMGIKKPKALLELNRETFIDRAIKQPLKYGARNFAILYGAHQDIVEYVDKKYKLNIKFCPDPPFRNGTSPGKGLALRHALARGIVEKKRSLFIFPDDVIIDNSYPVHLLKAHLKGIKQFGTVVTILFTKGQKYPFGTAKIAKSGVVLSFEEKPIINIPTNTGIFMAEPAFFDAIEKNIPLKSKQPIEWEKVVFPILAKEGKIYSYFIPANMWIPVNTIKELEEARARIK